MVIENLAYIAGFFDGEGDARIYMAKAPKNGKRYPRLVARVTQNDRLVLEWIRDQFGFGNIYVRVAGRINPSHQLTFTHRQARVFLTNIEPYLRVKKDNVAKLLDKSGRLASKA